MGVVHFQPGLKLPLWWGYVGVPEMVDTAEMKESAHFLSPKGVPLRGVSSGEYSSLLEILSKRYGISPLQMIENAGFSLAMVVRAALGLSATEGRCLVLANNDLAGCIALAGARHLSNGGAEILALVYPEPESSPFPLLELMAPLQAQQLPIGNLEETENEALTELLGESHNVICGLFYLGGTQGDTDRYVEALSPALSILNESSTPVHTIAAPVGVDVTTGKQTHPNALYASSTLSIGAPFLGLASAADFIGRHYLCDISIPPELYRELETNEIAGLFSEQPVVHLQLPKKER